VVVSVDLSVDIAGIHMRNPVMTASGTCGFGEELSEWLDLSDLGALVVKGTTLRPREGNRPPRVWETPAGMLNAIGLQNGGVDDLLERHLPRLATVGVPVIANISGDTLDDFAELAGRLDGAPGLAGLELNVSCPNIKAGGMAFGVCPSSVEAVTQAAREATRLPLIVKLSPNVTDITETARAAEAGGADALSLINTLLGLAIDVENRRPRLANVTGGLSGPAVRPVAVRMVWQVARAVSLPIVGMGGITRATDALEFIIAGAAAVAIGTGLFFDPRTPLDVVSGIEAYLARHGFSSVRELVGTLRS
jgi:dihydroorotate dehydrogenase (NAD+) catalytic subunit